MSHFYGARTRWPEAEVHESDALMIDCTYPACIPSFLLRNHFKLEPVDGKGSYVTTSDGTRLLDFSTGIGVANVGHCHPKVVKAVQEQAGKIMHAQVMGQCVCMCVCLARLRVLGIITFACLLSVFSGAFFHGPRTENSDL